MAELPMALPNGLSRQATCITLHRPPHPSGKPRLHQQVVADFPGVEKAFG